MTKWITDKDSKMLFLFEDDEVRYVIDLTDGTIVCKIDEEYKILLTEMQKLWINSMQQNEQTDQPA